MLERVWNQIILDAKTAAQKAALIQKQMNTRQENKGSSFRSLILATLLVLLSGLCASPVRAQADNNPLPQLVTENGRHALIVDGEPFLILGAQCHNSSAWPAMLPKVWPAIDYLHANTLEIPIYWEQFEPEPGKFDTSVVDTILTQARKHTCGWCCSGSAPGKTAARITSRCG